MPRVMFSISYGIRPAERERYLGLVRELKQHVTTVGKKNYSVFEVKGKKNHFSEVFVTESVEEFDRLEDDQDEKTEELVARIQECVDEKGMRYTTLVEA